MTRARVMLNFPATPAAVFADSTLTAGYTLSFLVHSAPISDCSTSLLGSLQVKSVPVCHYLEIQHTYVFDANIACAWQGNVQYLVWIAWMDSHRGIHRFPLDSQFIIVALH